MHGETVKLMPYLCYCLNDLGILVRFQEGTRDFLISEASRMTRCPGSYRRVRGRGGLFRIGKATGT